MAVRAEAVMSSPSSSSSSSSSSSASLAAAASCAHFRPDQLQLNEGVPLGSGAIGQVMQCRLRCTVAPSLPVVVKIVSKIQALQQGKVQCVMNEKAALLRLAPFPYVARLYGTAQSEDELYLVLEWLPHGDLLQHIRRVARERVRQYNEMSAVVSARRAPDEGAVGCSTRGAAPDSAPEAEASTSAGRTTRVVFIPATSTSLRCLDFHDVQLITAQLVLALSHTASRGVVLRDLKPENVAFDEKHRACLLDFDTVDLEGIANMPETNGGVACPLRVNAAVVDRVRGGADGHDRESLDHSGAALPVPRRPLTVSEIQKMRRRTSSFCGTAQYVSPEMVGECKWSFSSDLWALGALVYELVYGRHIFSGMSQFEVLQKVVHGSYAEREGLFPRIDFSSEGEAAKSIGGHRFDDVKDFIQRLLVTDPQKRLGVHPDTHCFNAAALRSHALFDGFQWALVEEHLHTFRMRDFRSNSVTPTNATPVDNGCEEGSSSDVTAALSSAALKALSAACVDPSASLASCYHILPFNDPAYAEYVYRATADVNPFEQFFTNGSADDAPAAAPTSNKASDSKANADQEMLAHAVDTDLQSNQVVGEGEIDDVIDDVGMHYTGHPADKDFQR